MAANAVVTPISLYVNSVKVAEATGGTLKLMNGVARVVTSDGVAFTLGKSVTDMSWKTIVPRAGMRARLYEAVLSKAEIKVQFTMDSKAWTVTGRMTEGGASWEVGSGALDGDFAFVGGDAVVL